MINRTRTPSKNKPKIEELVAKEQQASLKCSHTHKCAQTHTETGDHASSPLRDVMKHLCLNPCVFFFYWRESEGLL